MRWIELIGWAAVAALILRAALDWRSGGGWPLLIVAGALTAGLALRRRFPRE